MKRLIAMILFKLFVKIGGMLFPYVDIYSPDEDVVTGVTFSQSEDYINKVSDIE